jgi:hypothetical protein
MRLDDGTLRVFAAFATRTLTRSHEPRAVERDRDPPGPRHDRAFGTHRPCALVTDEFPAPTGSTASRDSRYYLGWQFSPGRVEDGWGVDDIMPMTGLGGGRAQATGVPMYRVDDIEAAVSRVRAAGGTATEPDPQPYGISAECVDDQGPASTSDRFDRPHHNVNAHRPRGDDPTTPAPMANTLGRGSNGPGSRGSSATRSSGPSRPRHTACEAAVMASSSVCGCLANGPPTILSMAEPAALNPPNFSQR